MLVTNTAAWPCWAQAMTADFAYRGALLHEIRLDTAAPSVELVRPDGVTRLKWLRQISVPVL